WVWAIPTPGKSGWLWIGGSIGGIIGIGFSTLMMLLGVYKRSFADYEEWEKKHLERQGGASAGMAGTMAAMAEDATVPSAEVGPVGVEAPASAALPEPSASDPVEAHASDEAAAKSDDPTELWILYPHARREMLRELLFLLPAICFSLAGTAI